MKNLKNVLIVGAAVLLTAGAVGGVAYLTKGFTTVEPIADLTKQGTVVYKLEKTVAPLTHIATFDIADDDQEAVSGGNFVTTVQLDDAEEFLANVPGTINSVQSLSLLSASQGELVADQESASGVLNVSTLFSVGSLSMHEWASTSAENTKVKAFDTVRINIDLDSKALLVSSMDVYEEIDSVTAKKQFAKVEYITSLQSYIDVDLKEIGEDGCINALNYEIVGLGGNVIPDLEIKSIELVNKACAYDFISIFEI